MGETPSTPLPSFSLCAAYSLSWCRARGRREGTAGGSLGETPSSPLPSFLSLCCVIGVPVKCPWSSGGCCWRFLGKTSSSTHLSFSLCAASSLSWCRARGRRVGTAGGSLGETPSSPHPSSFLCAASSLSWVEVGRAIALPRGATAPHSAMSQRNHREGYRPPSWGYRPTLRLSPAELSGGLPPSLVGLPPHTPPNASRNIGRATALPRGATAPHPA